MLSAAGWQGMHPWLKGAVAAAALALLAALAWSLVSRVPAVRFGDFPVFYSAGRLALDGPPAAAYDARLLAEKETRLLGDVPIRNLLGGSRPAQAVAGGSWGFYYPPMCLLLMMGLALLKYPAALLAWIFGSLGAYISALTRIAGPRQTLMLAITLPTVFMASAFAQTGVLIAAALAAGLLLLDRRPVLAGMILAALSLKPHLALLVPVVLLAGRHWQALRSMIATVLAAVLVSWALLGSQCWIEFFLGLLANQQQTGGGFYAWTQQSTVFAMLRSMGVAQAVAWTVHALVALAAVLVAILAWRRQQRGCREAALCAATVILPSHVLLYDLALLPVGVMFLLVSSAPAKRAAGLAIALCLVPLLAWALSAVSPWSLSALAPVALLVWVLRLSAGQGLRIGGAAAGGARSADAATVPARRALLALLGLVFVVGYWTLPAELYSGDSKLWREEARSLVLEGRLSVAPELADRDGIRGKYYVRNPRDGQWYSKYGVVNGLMNAIPMAAERFVTGELPPWNAPHRALILGLFFLLVSMALAAVLFKVAQFYTSNNTAIAVFVLLVFYTTYIWNYLRTTTSESTQALALAACFLFFLRYKRRTEALPVRPLGDLYWAWLALGVLCHIRFSFLLFLPLFAAAWLWLAWRDPPPRAGRWPLFLKAIVVPGLLIVTAQAGVHWLKFGSPLLSGYHESVDPPFPHTIGTVLYDFFVSWQWSLLIHFPPLLLAVAGARRFFRQHADEGILLLAFFCLTFAIVAPLSFWRGEWAYGPRYFVFLMPLFALPALYPLEWALTRAHGGAGATLPRAAFWIGTALVSVFSMLVQLEIHRSHYFMRYGAALVLHADKVPAVKEYLGTTHFAKINWDLLRCNGDWRCLPFAEDLRRTVTPEALTLTERRLPRLVSTSNLIWFPEINLPQRTTPEAGAPMPVVVLTVGGRTVRAEVAATDEQRGRGLMHRAHLADDTGMLFLFPLEEAGDSVCMWMKDTLVPLSVAFLDQDGRVINIEDMAPRSEESHCAASPARYALELNQAAFAKAGVGPGVRIGNLPPPDMSVPPPLPPLPVAELEVGGTTIRAELPGSAAEFRRGLKFRQALALDGGMLLRTRRGYTGKLCQSASKVNFALSAAYLDGTGRVLETADLEAGSAAPLCSLAPPAAYLLLVNRGILKKAGVAEGSRIGRLPPQR